MRPPRVRATTKAKYDGILRKHILPVLGRLQLKAITRKDIQQMMDGLARVDKRPGELSPRHKREVLLLLRLVFKFARRYELMERDPSELIETPKIARKKLRQEPEDNFSAELLSHVKGHFLEGPIFMALFLAFRRGETCGLQWPDIDAKHLEVTIRNQRHPLLGLSTPKSQSERVIPITPEILAMIERLGDRNSLFVFTDGKGRPLLENQVSKLVPKLIEEAGLRRCVYHDLRSYAASNLLELGADIQMVAEILGHTDLRTTALYLNATRRKKRSAIGGYFSSAIGGHAVGESASPLSGLTTDSSH